MRKIQRRLIDTGLAISAIGIMAAGIMSITPEANALSNEDYAIGCYYSAPADTSPLFCNTTDTHCTQQKARKKHAFDCDVRNENDESVTKLQCDVRVDDGRKFSFRKHFFSESSNFSLDDCLHQEDGTKADEYNGLHMTTKDGELCGQIDLITGNRILISGCTYM